MCGFSKVFLTAILSLLSVLTFVTLACAPAAQPEAPPIMINSALGPISADKLGQTLVHEHFVIEPHDTGATLQILIPVCEAAKAAGIQTIIDPTTNDMGGGKSRDPILYRELSQRTGINIVFATGLYTEAGGAAAYWKAFMASSGVDVANVDESKVMSELFIKDITEGVGTTGIKAGVIKIATGPTMTDFEKAVHKAAVIAQNATGVPIITHTEGPTSGVAQAEFLLSQGADPKKVMIGHVNNSKDVNYQRSILQKGVNVAFDRLGTAFWLGVSDNISVQNIATLCKEGYANKIMLSADRIYFNIDYPYIVGPQSVKKMVIKSLDKLTIDYIPSNIIPQLKAQGVTDDQINIMMVENPKNLFLGK